MIGIVDLETWSGDTVQKQQGAWPEQILARRTRSNRATFFAFAEDSPIGIAALYRTTERVETAELLQAWISPEYRSKRVAVKVLDAVFHWAAANAFRTIVSSVAKENERALRCYRKYGFRLADGASLDGVDDLLLVKECRSSVSPDE